MNIDSSHSDRLDDTAITMSKAQTDARTPEEMVDVHSVDSPEAAQPKRSMGQRFTKTLMTPGSALQIVGAAIVAIAIGMAVTTTVDNIPEAAPVILEIPGALWLRALRATGTLNPKPAEQD